MSAGIDLSGIAFGNVDASGCAAEFVSYLDRATDHFQAVKQVAHGLLGLRPAARLLDVGCGCGDDLRELATRIGPHGWAAGIDRSRSMIAESHKRCDETDLLIRLAVADAESIPFGSDCFDICRADRVLQHLPNPERALQEMVRVVKPGGRVLVVDRDWGMVTVDASDVATSRAILSRACGGIRKGYIGRQLEGFFAEAKLRNIEINTKDIHIDTLEVADTLLDLRVVLGHCVGEGLITEYSATKWIDDLLERDAKRKFAATVKVFIACGSKAAH